MKLKPPQVVVLSFLVTIVIGTLLLSLPIASNVKGGISLVDRIFTATSATCVTGLIVRDTPNDWSPFGKTVILFLFQAVTARTAGFNTLPISKFAPSTLMILIFLMFVGRIGLLTLALAVAIKKEKIVYTYPEEKVMVG